MTAGTAAVPTYTPTLFDCGTWLQIKDGDVRALAIYRRHYSRRRYRVQRQGLFVGPGEKLVLMSPRCDALFVWRRFKDDSGQQGVNCAAFRNEGPSRSSELVLAAEAFARARWPGERFYTYVNPAKLRSTNPGYCFLVAGWQRIGHTKGGLIILAKEPKLPE